MDLVLNSLQKLICPKIQTNFFKVRKGTNARLELGIVYYDFVILYVSY